VWEEAGKTMPGGCLVWEKFGKTIGDVSTDARKAVAEYTREEFDEVIKGVSSSYSKCDNEVDDSTLSTWCAAFPGCTECYCAIIERLMRERRDDPDCIWVVSKIYGEGPNRIIDRIFSSQERAVEYLTGKTLTFNLTLNDTGWASLRYDYADDSGCYIDTLAIPSYVITRYQLDV
jgi:hypothetical protein